mmetsp:Transcript_3858/g.5894  ORF Transcript_3858/g.5894 Transcript_3858/m.5894 type:complete len:266 (+) Transcript_3858:976-1773(+)
MAPLNGHRSLELILPLVLLEKILMALPIVFLTICNIGKGCRRVSDERLEQTCSVINLHFRKAKNDPLQLMPLKHKHLLVQLPLMLPVVIHHPLVLLLLVVLKHLLILRLPLPMVIHHTLVLLLVVLKQLSVLPLPLVIKHILVLLPLLLPVLKPLSVLLPPPVMELHHLSSQIPPPVDLILLDPTMLLLLVHHHLHRLVQHLLLLLLDPQPLVPQLHPVLLELKPLVPVHCMDYTIQVPTHINRILVLHLIQVSTNKCCLRLFNG